MDGYLEAEVGKANSWFEDTPIPILDNTLQFAKFLPVGDPLRRNPTTATRHTSQDTSHTRKKQRQSQPSHPFDIIIDSLKTGPCSVLHKFQRQRVCVVTRYVNSIRGSVTGILVAFDKHMNLILRDVEEVYSPRPLERHVMTNVELELERRRKILEDSNEESSEGWSVKRRNMKQIMLRGDNVVSVYRAEDESSRGKKTSH
jgi:small nuclear ribonucleoprotein (snRNP)-like protein